MASVTDAAGAAPAPVAPRSRAFAPFEGLLAGRYLRARRDEGFISVIALISLLGITLGVATLIVVLSVMNGFRKELFDKIVGLNGHVFVSAIERPLTDGDEVAKRLQAAPGVASAKQMIEGQALASSTVAASFALVRGMAGEDIRRIPALAAGIRAGTLDDFDAKAGVAIGSRLASQLALGVGDQLTLLSPRGAATPFGIAPRRKSYPVVAVYELGMTEFDTVFVYMPFNEADAYFDREGEASVVEVFLKNPDDLAEGRRQIEAAAGRPVLLVDWTQKNRTFFGALQVERNVMFLILSLIVLVAALNIVSGMVMLVRSKGPDIAILRTMGATRGAVLRVFLLTGAAIGVVGTALGVALGLVVALNVEALRGWLASLTNSTIFPSEIYFLSRLPAVVDPREVVTVAALALGLSLLATLYPAWKAASVDPVEGLRAG